MDVLKMLADLRQEREQIEEALRRHERLGGQRPPNWMADVTPKRRGRTKSRPSGSNDPGSQPPPAAPAAARIASRLDRAVSEEKQPARACNPLGVRR